MSRLMSLQSTAIIGYFLSILVFGVQFYPKFEHFISIADTISDEIFELNEVSFVTCTIKCILNLACVALLFNPRFKTCKTLPKYINRTLSNSSKEFENWEYYTLPYVTTCLELHALVPAVSGVYRIYPWKHIKIPVDVYCDMNTDGGGWTAIQRRVYGPVRFNRMWSEYKKGFGSAETEYWLGNDIIHALTVESTTSLYISITLTSGTTLYERYDQFYVTDETDGYRLHLAGKASGSLGDSMRDSNYLWNVNGMKFSTIERDNDAWSVRRCGYEYRCAWWFNSCGRTCLNSDGFHFAPWPPLVSNRTHISETLMMIK